MVGEVVVIVGAEVVTEEASVVCFVVIKFIRYEYSLLFLGAIYCYIYAHTRNSS